METEVFSYIALITSVGALIIGIANHKKIKSRCCKRELEVSFDIENTTPTRQPSS